MITASELAVAAHAMGHAAEVVPTMPDLNVQGMLLNFWRDPYSRYPDATVSITDKDIAWGHRWEHTGTFDTGEEAVRAIVATL